ncbi:MAG: fluoride efflux transporter CrcB [Candidatus Velthaea sp.]
MKPLLAAAAVALGGALGSLCRYFVSNWFARQFGPGFPWATFTINVTGAFAIGIVLQLAATRGGLSPYLRLFIATGILGGYTTFSTFAYETYALSSDAFSWTSIAYAGGSVAAGVAAAILGVFFVRTVQP